MHPRISHELAVVRQRELVERAARARATRRPGRRISRLGVVLAAVLPALALPAAADASVSASYDPASQTLAVFGDSANNNITVGRNAAGAIFVNGGAVGVVGGSPTVGNTSTIQMFGHAGDDALALDQSVGALPAAHLFGGADHDHLTGGSGGDLLFGQVGRDTLDSRGGRDVLAGGDNNDVVTGGDGDDQAVMGAGNDRFVWNPADDSDTVDDVAGTDTVEFNGGNSAEEITAIANGAGLVLARDAGTVQLGIGSGLEHVIVNANGGDDKFRGIGNLAALTRFTVDGGLGADTLQGGNGADTLRGGDGPDLVDGNQGADVVALGTGDDRFAWNPGDASDSVQGEDGSDRLEFDGSGANEKLAVAPRAERVRLTRDIAGVVVDFDGIEHLTPALMGGTDTLDVGDLTGTGVVDVQADLATARGAATVDEQPDALIVRGTHAQDMVEATGTAGNLTVTGLPATFRARGGEATDSLRLVARGGDDRLDASALPATAGKLTLQGDYGADTLLGGDAPDVLLGGPGGDRADGGPGGDLALLGDGRDRFEWRPGDSSDTVEGDAGTDSLAFTGSNATETFSLSANGNRVRLDRDVASITMDLGSVERTDVAALGGTDSINVNDLSGTPLTAVNAQLQVPFGTAGDVQADRVVVRGTNGDDHMAVAGGAGVATLTGLAATTRVTGAEPRDALEVRGLGGADTLDSSGLLPTIGLSFVQ